MACISIDPGTKESAVVVWDGRVVAFSSIHPNEYIVKLLQEWRGNAQAWPLVIEKVESYGMAVGEETFTTVWWSGVFAEAYGRENTHMVGRKVVKMHHCGSMKAKDGNVRQAIVDRFGGKKAAFGEKKAQGPLAGVTSHKMQALALALAWEDTH